MEDAENKELSFGEKAVGLTFNPSGDSRVVELKRVAAQFINLCDDLRSFSGEVGVPTDPEVRRMASIAITEAQTAQMWAVKAATWK